MYHHDAIVVLGHFWMIPLDGHQPKDLIFSGFVGFIDLKQQSFGTLEMKSAGTLDVEG